jgi:hypothetical protein
MASGANATWHVGIKFPHQGFDFILQNYVPVWWMLNICHMITFLYLVLKQSEWVKQTPREMRRNVLWIGLDWNNRLRGIRFGDIAPIYKRTTRKGRMYHRKHCQRICLETTGNQALWNVKIELKAKQKIQPSSRTEW